MHAVFHATFDNFTEGAPRFLINPPESTGTMVLEAATEAGGFPPAVSGRFFPFEAWPTHDSGAYR